MRHPIYFTLFCFAVGLTMFLHSREFNPELASSGDYTFLFYLSMFLAFTGTATDFKRKTANVIHFAGAVVCIGAAIAGITLQYQMYWLPIGWAITTAITIIFIKKRVWWVEILSFAWIDIALTILYL
jgi:hypothetical protein